MAKAITNSVYLVKDNDGDWMVYSDLAKDMFDYDTPGKLHSYLEGAQVMHIEFKPTHTLASPESSLPRLVKI